MKKFAAAAIPSPLPLKLTLPEITTQLKGKWAPQIPYNFEKNMLRGMHQQKIAVFFNYEYMKVISKTYR